jgi:hypothetical protein
MLVEPGIGQGGELHVPQLGDPGRERGLPLLVPASDEAARLVGAHRRDALLDAGAHRRDGADQQRHQPGRRRRAVLPAERHQADVLPPADVPHLDRLQKKAELVEKVPQRRVAAAQQRAGERQPRPGRVARLALPEAWGRLDRNRDGCHRGFGQRRDRARLQQEQLSAGDGPLDVLRSPAEVRLDPTRQRGHGACLDGVDRALRAAPAEGFIALDYPLVRRGPTGDQPLAQPADSADDGFVAIAGDGIRRECHSRRVGRDQGLDEDRHRGGVLPSIRSVRRDAAAEGRGPTAPHGRHQRVGAAYVQPRFVLPG